MALDALRLENRLHIGKDDRRFFPLPCLVAARQR
jgi:hypothetical protein